MNLSKLTDAQLEIAIKVIEEAERQGVNPDFVLPLVFQESRLGANTGPSKAGAIGIMQLMPDTAKYLGVDPMNMDQNIEGGVRYIKMLSDKLGGDPNLVAVAYNAGPNSAFFKSGKTEDLPDETVNYVDKLIEYAGGTLPPPMVAAKEAPKPSVPNAFERAVDELPSPPTALGASPPDVTGGPMVGRPPMSPADQRRIEASRQMGQIGGGTLGGSLGALNLAKDVLKGGMPPAPPPGSPIIPTRPGAQATPPAPTQALPDGSPRAPAGGTATQNYGRAFGLGDIEAGRAVDMTKQPGGVHDLTSQRRAGLGRVQSLFPNQFAENPRYGGLMTPTSPGLGPRGEAPRTPNRPASLAKKPSGLEQVSKAFNQIANSSPVRAAGRYGLPALSLGYGLGEGAAAYEGLQLKEPDYLDVGASGVSALGSALSLVPHPVARGAGMTMMGAKPMLDVLRSTGTPPEGMVGDIMAP